MLRNALPRWFSTSPKTYKILNNKQVQNQWNDYSNLYNEFDLGPQTFFYSLASILQLKQSKHILEVACGTGKLLPFALDQKHQTATYTAIDIAPKMIDLAKYNLKHHFDQYQSKITFQEWCTLKKISFEVANAENQLPKSNQLFDRIICNCALMITTDATKMLRNLHKHSAKGCLFGLSVWGSKEENNFMAAVRDSILENGYELPQQRSNFHLYGKVSELSEKNGWKTILKWDQNALFPILEYNHQQNAELYMHQINKLPQEQRENVKKTLYTKIENVFKEKKGLNFSCELYVLQKID